MIALEANAAALQRRLPSGWDLAPYAGDDLRSESLRGANVLVPIYDVYALRTHEGKPTRLQPVSYVALVSQAQERATRDLADVHWFAYTEDPAGVSGMNGGGAIAAIVRFQASGKRRRGETRVRETVSAVAERGGVHLSLAYELGGDLVVWATEEQPSPPSERRFHEDQVMDLVQSDPVMSLVRSDPLGIDSVSEISLEVQGELEDVFDGNERVVAVVIQRPYLRQVRVPTADASSERTAERRRASQAL
jgi:hypothetical protein